MFFLFVIAFWAVFSLGKEIPKGPYIKIDRLDKAIGVEDVVILMVDNRPLVQTDSKVQTSFQNIAASINAKYARSNGYSFRWYHSPCPSSEECNLDNSNRMRSAAWARIIAINDTLQEFSKRNKPVAVVYLDSDAYISDHLARIGPSSASIAAWQDEVPKLLCSGAMIIRNTAKTADILNFWWNTKEQSQYDLSRQWDQAVLNGAVMKRYHHDIVKLPSAGWTTGKELIFWDSGYLSGVAMSHRNHDKYSLTKRDKNKYRTFVKHYWGGLAVTKIDHMMNDLNRTESSLLTMKDFKKCPGHAHLYCLL